MFVGQSGLGKSRLIQNIGQAACRSGLSRLLHHQRRTPSDDLTAALADQTIHDRVRFYARFELLIIDEFGLDRIERSLCPQAASLWYKIIDARSQRVSTALVTNIDFESWAEYLGDAPLAMALLDRVVDGATIVKLKGKSYRVHRGADEPSAKLTAPTHWTSSRFTPPRRATPLGPPSSRENGPLSKRDQHIAGESQPYGEWCAG